MVFYLPTNKAPNNQQPIMANIDNSIARFSASMAEIKAAQRHTVLIDLPKKAVAGKTTKMVIKNTPAETTQAPKPKSATKSVQNTEVERTAYVISSKKTVAKKSKLGKLVSSKKVFDFSH